MLNSFGHPKGEAFQGSSEASMLLGQNPTDEADKVVLRQEIQLSAGSAFLSIVQGDDENKII